MRFRGELGKGHALLGAGR